jgi:DNA polymerase II small subunit
LPPSIDPLTVLVSCISKKNEKTGSSGNNNNNGSSRNDTKKKNSADVSLAVTSSLHPVILLEDLKEVLPEDFEIPVDKYNNKKKRGEEEEETIVAKQTGRVVDMTKATTIQGTESELIGQQELQQKGKSLTGIATITIPKEIEILADPTRSLTPSGVEGFRDLFQSRLKKTLHIFSERPDSSRIQKISDLKSDLLKFAAARGDLYNQQRLQQQHQQQRNMGGAAETRKIVGLVTKKISRKNQIELTIEDSSDQVSVLVVNDSLKRIASEVILDQAIGVDVFYSGPSKNRNTERSGLLIAKSIFHPDIPDHVPSVSKKRVYVILISDLHIGSKMFLSTPFKRFIKWLVEGKLQHKEGDNLGKGGEIDGDDNDDSDIVKRIGYIIIGGDCVDGVGVYPEQEYQLAETNIYKQYEMLASYLKEIPKRITLIIGPGNHDATRQALPQPTVSEKYAEDLHKLPNTTMIGDPALIKLHGVKFLVYHGRSLDDVLAVTPGLSYSRPASAMKVLLRARHLAPTFGARTPIAPEKEDNLVISEVPDVFHAGHVHTMESQIYKGTLIINSGTWQAQTPFQQNMGIVPTPGIVPFVDLSTLEVFARSFVV